jgi:hypothetical protein
MFMKTINLILLVLLLASNGCYTIRDTQTNGLKTTIGDNRRETGARIISHAIVDGIYMVECGGTREFPRCWNYLTDCRMISPNDLNPESIELIDSIKHEFVFNKRVRVLGTLKLIPNQGTLDITFYRLVVDSLTRIE